MSLVSYITIEGLGAQALPRQGLPRGAQLVHGVVLVLHVPYILYTIIYIYI